jgi:ArsR family transcriptional regulator, lead/cadmium/zinc/bismuth-responsive transcriptional repressor
MVNNLSDPPAETLPIAPVTEAEDLCCELPHEGSLADPASLVPAKILTVEKAQRMSEFLGFLADTNRLRILSILADKEMCVGDLATALQMNESAVSHQLRTLRAIRLVNFRKQGRHVFYRLQDHHVLEFYQAVEDHLDETIT